MIISVTTNSRDETQKVAEKFAKLLKKGDVVLLIGDLGTGKTTFTQFLTKALGVKNYVTSPSFKLMNEYCGKFDLIHFDFYRLNNIQEIEDIGWYEHIESNAIVIVEWAERARKLWPKNYWAIHFEYLGENKRQIRIQRSE